MCPERRTGQPAADALPDVLADGVGAGVAVGDADVGATVGCGVAVPCGEAVRCGDGVADGLGVRWRGVRLGEEAGVGVGEGLCCAAGLSPALALGAGGLTHPYSTSVPRNTAISTQVEVLTRRISRRSRWTRRPPAWATG